MRAKIIGLVLGMMIGLQGATQSFAWTYGWTDALGKGGRGSAGARLYPPWSILVWRKAFAEEARGTLNRSGVVILLGAVAGLSLGALADAPSALPRRRGWGGLAEARRAGLLAKSGAVLGLLHGRLLATDDLRPTLVTGGTRSGKGRGHVVPSLLSWTGSVLVHDPKGELWTVTAGWRSRFTHALYLNPRQSTSARWNARRGGDLGQGGL